MAAHSSILPAISRAAPKCRWRDLYNEAELYKCAVRLYTKPLFSWRKALLTSTDKKDLYDFARRGPQNLAAIHGALQKETFTFRPGVALHRNFRGKKRTLYIYPWEERLVDLLLYRLLSARFHHRFSENSYAYRLRGFGLDRCQHKIAALLASANSPLFVAKRDIASYFPSVDQTLLLHQLQQIVEPDDYLFQLLHQRVRFQFEESGAIQTSLRGIPFGTPIACFFANLYLTPLDRQLDSIPSLHYLRYADDLLFFSEQKEAVVEAVARFDAVLTERRLSSKASHEQNLLLSRSPQHAEGFTTASRFRHLGLEFSASVKFASPATNAGKSATFFVTPFAAAAPNSPASSISASVLNSPSNSPAAPSTTASVT
ncbi:MAG TPA: reverse transcriptase domain-containing protein, partial [Candidatus Limnocylindrales bacterium]|nr:reverse transcriptase domain-containing protein [Candidatus Limnocylindrales bacterium]